MDLNCKQTKLILMFFDDFFGYDSILLLEDLLPEATKQNYESKPLPTSLKKYVSVQIECLRFMDSNLVRLNLVKHLF